MAEQKTIDVEPRHLKMVNTVFARHLPFKKVWAFGSRVKWTASKTSDLDCVVFGATDMEIHKAQEAFDESDVPFEVQLLNWETIPDDFKENIKKEYFVLRKESDWGERRIGDFARVTSSKRIFLSDYVESGIPFWRSKEVIEQFKGKDISTELFISQSRYQEIKDKFGVPKEGDILLTSVGTIGVPYLVKSDDLFYFKDGNLTWIKDIPNTTIDSKYVFLWLSSPIGQKIIDGYLIGSSQKALTIDSLKKISLPIPPLSIQRKIAGVLSAYDDLIENNNKRIKILEEMAQKLYKEWFVDFKFPNHENTKFIDSELGKIPEGWDYKSVMSDLCETFGGGTPSTKNQEFWGNGDVLWLTPTDITKNNCLVLLNCEKKITELGLKKSSAKMLPPYAILMTSRASVGFFGLIGKPVSTNQGFISIVPKKEHFRMYLLFNLLSRVSEIRALAGGATYAEISKTTFRQMKIVTPAKDILEKFNNFCFDIILNVENIRKKNENLRKTRDLLLPRLISGELAVEDLEVAV